MALLIAFAVLSIGVSFLCSILEAALLSLTPSFIAHQKLERPRLHERLKVLKDQVDQPLAAILTLNTVAHTVGATGVGAQVTLVFGDGYLGIASAIMTVLILVLSEIVPKTIGARYWRSLAPFLPPLLNTMILLLKPFIWLSDLVMKLFGGNDHDHDVRQEIKALSILGRELGKVDADEQRVIANVLDLHEVKVREVMTPRIVCVSVRPDMPLDDFHQLLRKSQFSRYPVLDEHEVPQGMIMRRDLLMREPEHQVVADMMTPALIVSDMQNVEQVMNRLMQERQHIALVYDEYGSWQGVVTMEDILETIIGQSIMDETDAIPNMRRFARRRWASRRKELAE
ncbi:CNNM domain-containing protein [Marinobacterium weihaiense]|uniref:DUF21 domain-containing protein n=1 Tax=Marinobacterium weihaiense TaxID=2851016 RepID=A0ABS6M9U9_9GAMM|nr:CNNM domain-containing protein [Marinobacterium weihaiense]MBV0932666.1 DUF21 domain-containing protein [Marinobacterium weihaiense]